MSNQEMITISRAKYDELQSSARMLLALEGVGVDNWEGYDYAIELLEEMDDEQEE